MSAPICQRFNREDFFYSYLFSKDEIAPSPIEKSQNQQLLMEKRLAQYRDDYIAHAIWNGNFSSVVEMQAILPSEALFRMKKVVEYEKGGTTGSRGTTQLEDLSPKDFKKIESLNLTKEEEEHLSELELFFNNRRSLNIADYTLHIKYGIQNIYTLLDLRSKYWRDASAFVNQNINLLSPEEEKLIKDLNELNELCEEDIEVDEKKYEELFDKVMDILYCLQFRLDVIKLKKNQLKYLKRKKSTGIAFNQPISGEHISFYHKHSSYETFSRAPFGLARCEFVGNNRFGNIAFDHYKNNPVDSYLNTKYVKWMKQKPQKRFEFTCMLFKARLNQFNPGKLNSEIRAARNSVYWSYGDIALLRGNPKEIILGDSKLKTDVSSGEVFYFLLG